ncbi:hypothetical protein R4Y45_03635 [Holzapfeliella sp. He02]|uniref:Uncharacterized protein n=1 Tax=Holzapfeliella saturejae TaxID=3082953 RepID=A0ABU8SI06_9LACO
MIFIIITVGLIVSYLAEMLLKNSQYFSGYDVFSIFAWSAVINLSLINDFIHVVPVILILLACLLCGYAIYTAIVNRNIYMKVFLAKFCRFQSFLSIISLLILIILTMLHKFL